MKRQFLLFFLSFAWIASLRAEQWIKVTSANFEMYTPAGERKARAAIQYFEQVRSFFAEATHSDPKMPHKVRLVGFTSEKEFRLYSPHESVQAFYQAGPDRDFIVMKDLDTQFYQVTVHEFIHLLVKYSGRKLPVWMNEGLADFYSTLKPVGAKVQVGEFKVGSYATLLRENWIPLDQLTGADYRSPFYNEKKRIGIFYSESWALTHMLVMADEYRPKAGTFMNEIERKPAVRVFGEVYGKTLPEVFKDLQGYMRQGSYKVLLFPVKLSKSAEMPETESIATADANVVLGEVLAYGHKRAEAEEMLNRVLAANPKSAEAYETLGYAGLYDNRDEIALDNFAKASELGSDNAGMYRDYASLLQRARRYGDMAAQLNKLLKLQPDNTAERLRMGQALLMNKQYGSAMSELVRIQKIGPDKALDFFRTLAFCYLNLDQPGLAKENALKAKKYAKEPHDIENIDRLLAYLERPSRKSVPTAQDQDEAPKIARRPPGDGVTFSEQQAQEQLSRIQGSFEKLDCVQPAARIHVRTKEKTAVLVIDDPGLIRLQGKNGQTIEMTCGPQKQTGISVGYIPKEDAASGTLGLVRAIDFE